MVRRRGTVAVRATYCCWIGVIGVEGFCTRSKPTSKLCCGDGTPLTSAICLSEGPLTVFLLPGSTSSTTHAGGVVRPSMHFLPQIGARLDADRVVGWVGARRGDNVFRQTRALLNVFRRWWWRRCLVLYHALQHHLQRSAPPRQSRPVRSVRWVQGPQRSSPALQGSALRAWLLPCGPCRRSSWSELLSVAYFSHLRRRFMVC